MRPARTIARVAFCLSTMGSLATAWPTWIDHAALALVGRAEDDESETTSKAASKPTGNLNTAATLDPDAPRTTAGSKGSSSGGGNSTKTREEFDPTEPAGGAVMVTPDPRLGNPLIKAGDIVSFTWNYTNLLAEPTAVDVLLSRSGDTNLWTLTANMSFQDPATYTWDTNEQATDASHPLLTDEFTMIIKDSDASVSDTGEPGYLSRTDVKVDIYTPRPYTPLNEWNCATCSAAMSDLDQKALMFATSMCLITVASFTWFVTGLNL
ncbi:hypothetical protein jhhlp_002047 [Lomentospora prolificans]|uniref:DUF7137 domain-containing protein n=1 Tax=Lomentospora prolificans TaxID=41688 RepID=A0A2N3NCW0_9PEZI|nr:hypothetical protein jhhlp_002047 [Lomentospora prolificans]